MGMIGEMTGAQSVETVNDATPWIYPMERHILHRDIWGWYFPVVVRLTQKESTRPSGG